MSLRKTKTEEILRKLTDELYYLRSASDIYTQQLLETAEKHLKLLKRKRELQHEQDKRLRPAF